MIKSAEFIVSNTKIEHCPADLIPEYAFIGRSNVGKSSLINMICDRKNIAKILKNVRTIHERLPNNLRITPERPEQPLNDPERLPNDYRTTPTEPRTIPERPLNDPVDPRKLFVFTKASILFSASFVKLFLSHNIRAA